MELFAVTFENYLPDPGDQPYCQFCGVFVSLEEAKTAIAQILKSGDYLFNLGYIAKIENFYITPIQIGDLVDWNLPKHWVFRDGDFSQLKELLIPWRE